MKSSPPALLLALLLLPAAAGWAAPDDEAPGEEALVTRLFDVGALTAGRSNFWREVGPDEEGWAGEDNPLFGTEAEEGTYPLGQVDELIGLIQMQVAPESWESTLGASIWCNGEGTLVVRAWPDVVAQVGAWLLAMEQRHMRRVAVDVATFRLAPAQRQSLCAEGSDLLLDAGRLLALPPERVGPSAALLAYERQRAAVYAGRQHAYLRGYEVEVAQDASISDPVVAVANLGLAADVSCVLGTEARSVLVELSAVLTKHRGSALVETGADRLVELPTLGVARVRTKVEVPVGAWALVDGAQGEGAGDGWFFAVRATALPAEGLGDAARAVMMDTPAARPSRQLELRSFDIGLLCQTVDNALGQAINLVPSNFTPPEPPELAEPMPIFPAESIVELIRESVVPSSWELKGASIEARNGWLYVRNAPEVLRVIGERLDVLRREFVGSIAHNARLVQVPEALARRLGATPGRVLDAGALGALDAAVASDDGAALGEARVTTMQGARNAVTVGRRVRYLGDYEVEIAQGSQLAQPILWDAWTGVGLDVEAHLTSGGGALQSTVRFQRTRVDEPLRTVPTPHGDLHVPAMDVFRVRAVLEAPLGQTVVVASHGDGERRTLLLLTAHLRRAQ